MVRAAGVWRLAALLAWLIVAGAAALAQDTSQRTTPGGDTDTVDLLELLGAWGACP